MQNRYFKFLIIVLAVAVIAPQIALAAWWNPFSWGIWNRIFHFQQTEQKQEQRQNTQQNQITNTECQNLYWFDNTASDPCSALKQFCGAYMYYGLKTFATQSECQNEWSIASGRGPLNSQNTQTADWKTYINTEYGFEIKYPQNDTEIFEFEENLKMVTEFQNGQKIIVLPQITISSKNAVSKDARVTIDVGTNKENIDNCLKFDFDSSNPNMSATKNINGGIFYTQSSGDPLKGKSLETQYSTVKNGICYTVKTIVNWRDVTKNTVEGRDKYIQEQKDFISSIISTFKFTK